MYGSLGLLIFPHLLLYLMGAQPRDSWMYIFTYTHTLTVCVHSYLYFNCIGGLRFKRWESSTAKSKGRDLGLWIFTHFLVLKACWGTFFSFNLVVPLWFSMFANFPKRVILLDARKNVLDLSGICQQLYFGNFPLSWLFCKISVFLKRIIKKKKNYFSRSCYILFLFFELQKYPLVLGVS